MPKRLVPLLLLVLLLGLQGCTVPRQQVRRANALVVATTPPSSACLQPDHCAMPSPVLDAATAALRNSTPAAPQHVVTLLADSEDALAARLNLIRAARHSIDVQTYIWDQDDVGQLMLDALVQAARRGVQVRILADQLFSFGDIALLDRLARADRHLAVRLYNPTFHDAETGPVEFAAGIVCCFMKFNQRMHNKVLLVDDTVGITGGRNYQDRYFNWDGEFDYVDRDVLVGGPAARDMAASFALFWNHKRSVPLTALRDVNRYILAHPQPSPWRAPQFRRPQRVARLERDAGDPAWIDEHLLQPAFHTGEVEFFSDLPAKTDTPTRRHALDFTHHVMKLVADAREEVVLQTPYLVMSDRAQAIFRTMHRRADPPRIRVSTNSLASTDAFAVYALSYKHRKRYLRTYGFEIEEMKPHAAAAEEDYALANEDLPPAVAAEVRARRRQPGAEARGMFGSRGKRNRPAPLTSPGLRFGLHAKSIVVDDRFAMVGSHNFDPRSDHFNTEAGVIVHDAAFARAVRDSILQLTGPANAWVIAPRKPVVPVLTSVNQAIGDISEKLPLFDFWPYRYATSYDLKPGCTPMAPHDPAFFSCYEPVGDFPGVALSFKLIYTRLITAFGSAGSGIL
ncbi:phosphatidylserine/phosphatidylglycerophosphate/cardiolipin synthase family protein [Dyella sp.]|jgi:phosphatidylserine/phosphatidylglycerophosphate/cardiolipin synthase-like enzyme|uniref:phospholipase D-like domain-containing protein n=1 Tax=Dyella sp. TaxID=1869338 RepID=UPI002D7653D3|nr:phosphatidylserine/phosphatidylglycerophosphate/cardiolipin synthase family protein [Dyella sp.]HET6433002.1 phosphatidylserine/phosphatidylglycerophosphate/cardiolipin synthase family protein [Dyella sp.]